MKVYGKEVRFSCAECGKKFASPAKVAVHYRASGHKPKSKSKPKPGAKAGGLPTAKRSGAKGADAGLVRFCVACGRRRGSAWVYCGNCGSRIPKGAA